MKKRELILTLLVFTLIIDMGIQPAFAYFTTYATAEGQLTVNLGDTTKITESFSDWTKHVVISNEEGSEPVFIRARVIYTGLNGENGFTATGEGWTEEIGGWYYYGSSDSSMTILPGGRSTSELTVAITDIPENPEDGTSFSVIVLYESTPVRYNQNRQPYADWDAAIIWVTEGGNG